MDGRELQAGPRSGPAPRPVPDPRPRPLPAARCRGSCSRCRSEDRPPSPRAATRSQWRRATRWRGGAAAAGATNPRPGASYPPARAARGWPGARPAPRQSQSAAGSLGQGEPAEAHWGPVPRAAWPREPGAARRRRQQRPQRSAPRKAGAAPRRFGAGPAPAQGCRAPRLPAAPCPSGPRAGSFPGNRAAAEPTSPRRGGHWRRSAPPARDCPEAEPAPQPAWAPPRPRPPPTPFTFRESAGLPGLLPSREGSLLLRGWPGSPGLLDIQKTRAWPSRPLSAHLRSGRSEGLLRPTPRSTPQLHRDCFRNSSRAIPRALTPRGWSWSSFGCGTRSPRAPFLGEPILG